MDPIAMPEVATEDFSLLSLFLRADPIVQAVMGILVVCSIWSWAVAVDKWLSMMAARARANRFEQAFWSGQTPEDVADRGGDRLARKASDALARIFAAGAQEWRDARRGSSGGGQGAESAALVERARAQMAVAVSRETVRLETGLPTLAIIASSTPFIGLFGTVIGIMNAFREIAARGETNLTVVAPGIAEALFATALGLGAAIPALVFYNKFSGDISRFADRMEAFAQEFSVRLSKRLDES